MKDKLSQYYDTIFEKYRESDFKTLIERGYVFQYDDDEVKADLLFIGINPSYTRKNENGKSTRNNYSRNVEGNYFKPFKDINQELVNSEIRYNGIYTHLDLLVFRETNQKIVDLLVKTDVGCNFLMEQLAIAKQRIINICPRIVIVSNSKAREFLGKDKFIDKKGLKYGVWMGLDFNFDEEYGVHKVTNIPELNNTYFLFCSMLSGQRALDIGSRERMIWQIKRILKI